MRFVAFPARGRTGIDARALQAVAINGSGDLTIEQFKADALNLSIVGSGDVQLGLVELHGSGDVSLGVTEQLDVKLSGSGDLSYAGRPQLRQSVSGSGEIHRR